MSVLFAPLICTGPVDTNIGHTQRNLDPATTPSPCGFGPEFDATCCGAAPSFTSLGVFCNHQAYCQSPWDGTDGGHGYLAARGAGWAGCTPNPLGHPIITEWYGDHCSGIDIITSHNCCVCPPGYTPEDQTCGHPGVHAFCNPLCVDRRCSTAGKCYCNGTCIDCPPQPNGGLCASELHCYWDSTACAWHCDTPSCAAGEIWDYTTCTCTACPAGTCPCALTGTCVSCPDPPCKTELHCTWNSSACVWDCDTPSCTGTDIWDPAACHCCPPGYRWCETSATCIVAADPPCKDQLHCAWDTVACVWVCDDPANACGPGIPFVTGTCSCPSTGVWNLHSPWGQYHIVHVGGGKVNYQSADFSIPPFTLANDVTPTGATEPRVAYDLRRRAHLVYVVGGDVVERISDDDGATFGSPTTMFTGGKHPTLAISPRTGLILRVAYVSAKLKGTIQAAGDVSPSAAFTMKDDAGTDLAPADDTFHVTPAPDDAERWLLIVVVGSAVKNYQSWDDGMTWTEIP